MGYRHKVVRVTLQGQMLGGAEEWQTGFYVGQMSADATEPTQAWVDAVRDAWATIWTTAARGISDAYTFNQVKAAVLGTDGKYDPAIAPVISYPNTALVGGSTGNPLPPQCSLVATLVAGSGKGLAGKGRMYIPGVRIGVDGGGKLSESYTSGMATALAGFFNTINSAGGAPGRVINASEGTRVLVVPNPKNLLVNGVRVGNVYDTQRRRRNALDEQYQHAVVTDPA